MSMNVRSEIKLCTQFSLSFFVLFSLNLLSYEIESNFQQYQMKLPVPVPALIIKISGPCKSLDDPWNLWKPDWRVRRVESEETLWVSVWTSPHVPSSHQTPTSGLIRFATILISVAEHPIFGLSNPVVYLFSKIMGGGGCSCGKQWKLKVKGGGGKEKMKRWVRITKKWPYLPQLCRLRKKWISKVEGGWSKF